MNTLAITGATGNLGRLVIASLKQKVPASSLVALARSPEKGADLGVAVREADYDRPSSLGPAMTGVDTLLLISASEVGQRALQHHNIFEAAKAAGVKRIVYTSLLHADRSPLQLAEEHRSTEAELKALGIPYTILRNGWYTENYEGSLRGALATGALVGSARDAKISAATRSDYAEAAAIVATSEGHDGQTYELAGDEAFTMEDLAAELSRQAGREIPYRDLPEAEYAAVLGQAGLPEPAARMVAHMDVAAAEGALFDDSRQLSRLIGRPTTPLSVTVATVL